MMVYMIFITVIIMIKKSLDFLNIYRDVIIIIIINFILKLYIYIQLIII